MNEWYYKPVDGREVLFMNELKGTGIIPDFEVEINSENNSHYYPYILKTKKYPYTWGEMLEMGYDMTIYKKKLAKLIDLMHEHGIFHNDMHDNNVVVDPDTKDVRIIDLGISMTIFEVIDDEKTDQDYISDRISREKIMDREILNDFKTIGN
ncbi:MAG: serine/threonine-protein kinase [Candidatus Woesearchaeota archaeon]|jgi:tRNA A-37 threonylcarbamoyl transferase component Bud32